MKFNIDQFKANFPLIAIQTITENVDVYNNEHSEYSQDSMYQLFLKVVRRELEQYDVIDLNDDDIHSIASFVKYAAKLERGGDPVHIDVENVVKEIIASQQANYDKSITEFDADLKSSLKPAPKKAAVEVDESAPASFRPIKQRSRVKHEQVELNKGLVESLLARLSIKSVLAERIESDIKAKYL